MSKGNPEFEGMPEPLRELLESLLTTGAEVRAFRFGPGAGKEDPRKQPEEGPVAPGVLDRQEGGDHYKRMGAFQPWEVLPHWMTEDELRGFAKGTAIVYLARENFKGGLGDIRKALHTLELFMSVYERHFGAAANAAGCAGCKEGCDAR